MLNKDKNTGEIEFCGDGVYINGKLYKARFTHELIQDREVVWIKINFKDTIEGFDFKTLCAHGIECDLDGGYLIDNKSISWNDCAVATKYQYQKLLYAPYIKESDCKGIKFVKHGVRINGWLYEARYKSVITSWQEDCTKIMIKFYESDKVLPTDYLAEIGITMRNDYIAEIDNTNPLWDECQKAMDKQFENR